MENETREIFNLTKSEAYKRASLDGTMPKLGVGDKYLSNRMALENITQNGFNCFNIGEQVFNSVVNVGKNYASPEY